jgi:ectoine hydroxylase-related dioxygenase (phytanoyl-CoA dioxygenase family)
MARAANRFYISEQIRKDYQENGVVLLRNVLDRPMLDVLERGVEYNRKHPSPRAKIASSPESDPGEYLEDFCNWQRIPEYRFVLCESVLPQIAADLMMGKPEQKLNVRLYHDHLLVKTPGTQQITPWHQDQPYYNITGMDNVSFWIPLDEVSQENSLRLVPGSHRSGTWYLPRTFQTQQAMWFPEGSLPEIPSVDERRVVSWAMQPGDVIAFHMLTIHGASGSSQLRRVMGARYVGNDTQWVHRPWKTSPDFQLPPDATIETYSTLFPIVWETKQHPEGKNHRRIVPESGLAR